MTHKKSIGLKPQKVEKFVGGLRTGEYVAPPLTWERLLTQKQLYVFSTKTSLLYLDAEGTQPLQYLEDFASAYIKDPLSGLIIGQLSGNFLNSTIDIVAPIGGVAYIGYAGVAPIVNVASVVSPLPKGTALTTHANLEILILSTSNNWTIEEVDLLKANAYKILEGVPNEPLVPRPSPEEPTDPIDPVEPENPVVVPWTFEQLMPAPNRSYLEMFRGVSVLDVDNELSAPTTFPSPAAVVLSQTLEVDTLQVGYFAGFLTTSSTANHSSSSTGRITEWCTVPVGAIGLNLNPSTGHNRFRLQYRLKDGTVINDAANKDGQLTVAFLKVLNENVEAVRLYYFNGTASSTITSPIFQFIRGSILHQPVPANRPTTNGVEVIFTGAAELEYTVHDSLAQPALMVSYREDGSATVQPLATTKGLRINQDFKTLVMLYVNIPPEQYPFVAQTLKVGSMEKYQIPL